MTRYVFLIVVPAILIGCQTVQNHQPLQNRNINSSYLSDQDLCRTATIGDSAENGSDGRIRWNPAASASSEGRRFSAMHEAQARGLSLSQCIELAELDATPRTASVPDRIDRLSLEVVSSGSGFFVSYDGHIITNNHVIDRCKKINAVHNGQEIPDLDVIGSDKRVDLAILRGNVKPESVAVFRASGSVQRGSDIIAVGFPLQSILGSQIKVTRGLVNSTVGMNNDINRVQISAQIQPGNSGGPLVDDTGRVVGVVVSKT